MELTPAPDFTPKTEAKRVRIRDLVGRIFGLKRQLLQIFCISLGIEFCGLLSPLYVQWVVDHALVSGDRDLLTLLALACGLLALTNVLVTALRSWVVLNFSMEVNQQWTANVFTHLLRLPQSWFEKRHLGDVVSRFDSVGAIQKTITTSFLEAVVDGLMATVVLAMMLIYSPLLSSLSILTVLLYTLLRLIAFSPLRSATEEQIALAAKQQSSFLESVRGIQAIKLFGKEALRQLHWHSRYVDSANRATRTQRYLIGYKLANGALLGVEAVICVWLGAQLVLTGTFSVGMLFAFMAFKTVFTNRISSLVDKVFELRMLRLQGERLADIVHAARDGTSAMGAKKSEPIPPLRLHRVSFQYSTIDPLVLDDVSFDLPTGKSIAIVGPSGSGKTTLAKLILGLLNPVSGQVFVGDHELSSFGLSSYRQHVKAVMQDDHLFAGSIADNISFFSESFDQHKAEHAARLACIHEDVERMAMGYSTLVGDMGTALSGGQKQRLLLARALYHDPQILVLDEATSHLDVALEKAVNLAICRLSMTRIVIAHRPETIASCDVVIDLSQINRACSRG